MPALRRTAIFAILALAVAAGSLTLRPAHAQTETVFNITQNPTLGAILTAPNGMTLYVFAKDAPGVSNCNGGCAGVWPPLAPPADGSLNLPSGATGTIDAFARADGTMQVEYNGMPLYSYSGDMAPGDTNGNGIGGVWSVATPGNAMAGMSGPGMQTAIGIAQDPTLGAILTAPNGMTVYAFAMDTPGVSNCNGGCAALWPPLAPPADGSLNLPAGATGTIDSFMRADGTMQVEYNGMPLYTYAKDSAPGDTNGNGFLGVWSIVAP